MDIQIISEFQHLLATTLAPDIYTAIFAKKGVLKGRIRLDIVTIWAGLLSVMVFVSAEI